jgi:hypothetical protein
LARVADYGAKQEKGCVDYRFVGRRKDKISLYLDNCDWVQMEIYITFFGEVAEGRDKKCNAQIAKQKILRIRNFVENVDQNSH